MPGKDDRSYPCAECSEVLSRDHDLERHRLAKHATEAEKARSSYYCRCGAHSIQKTNIAGHIRSAHTGETIRCGTCTFEATSDATLTRHRQETGHEPAPRRRKPRAKKSSPDSASSSPTPDIRTVADFISFYGDVPLTYNEYDLYRALVRNAQGQAPPTPPITSDTSLTANLTAAPPSRMSTSTTPALTPLVLAASVPEAPSPVMARAATPTPSPECFLAIPEEARLPPIGIGHRDYYSTAPLTAQVLQPKIPAQPSHYHRYGPY